MSAMKEKFMDLQEKVYARLEDLGMNRETIYEFEKMFDETDFFEFAEQMSGYAMAISIFSDTTEYDSDRLWGIWKGCVQTFQEGESACSTIEEEWNDFKTITQEGDW